jgi:hypothetical protein
MLNELAILPTAYLPPIQYFQKLRDYSNCIIEQHESFIKQTYRSRCNIYSPNGLYVMSIPIVNRSHKQFTKDARISYETNWRELHWRTLEAAYRRSPFFEFYEDDFRPFYQEKKFDFLIDFNEELLQTILPLLKLKPNYTFSNSYISTDENMNDYRLIISPKENLSADKLFSIKPYSQVFDTKYGFIENLSIVDLLFNQGSISREYI